ncbi:MAG: type II secretion system protein [Oscillospiraceae bacterium]|nr:type II secretion system protein [Oscillospiraceae bacterium]
MSIYNLKNDKRGMTLVEMIVSLVILSILMTSTMGMITSSMSIFTSTSMAALDKMVGNSVFQTLESSAKYSTHMTISDTPISDSAGTKSFMINNASTANDGQTVGQLYFRQENDNEYINLYDSAFYNGRKIQYKIEKAGNDNRHIRITVSVYRDGDVVYVRDGLIKCVNLGLLKTGVSANEINDTGVRYDSNKKAVNANQYLYFTVDELLIAGGESAWSIEYKLQEYMNKYNAILSEYAGKLSIAQTKISQVNALATAGTVVEYQVLEDAKVEAANAIFGTPAYTSTASSDSYFIPGSTNNAKAEGENASTYFNIRKYYQEQIYDLLKFSPMVTEGYTNSVPERITSNGTYFQNPYYGVVATKEQLFTGFMLTYYDKNKDGQITKSEYPQFDNPKSVLAGTMFNSAGYSDSMIILARMWENSAERYNNLISLTNKTILYYEVGQRNTIDTTWVTGNATGKSFPSSTVQDSYTSNPNNTGVRCFSVRRTNGEFGNRFGYNINTSLYGEEFLANITTYTNSFRTNWDDKIYNTIINHIGAVNIKGTYAGVSTSNSNSVTTITLYAYNDIPEGWYYYNEGSKDDAYHIFYLEAPQQYSQYNPGKIAVPKNMTIELYSKKWSITASGDSKYRYQQIKFIGEGNAENRSTGNEQVYTYQINQHHYDDYILYSADWNSWFGKPEKGLLNQVTGTIASWIDGSREINSITGQNAYKSLGNTGNFSINSLSLQGKSYNMAWIVYNQKRGTWYYLPSGSSRISSLLSGTTWYSNADTPTALDLNGWGGSSAMIADIEGRKLSSSVLFGVVDSTSDVLWVALPSNNVVSEITTEGS